jgi:hypothetical protein
MAFANLSRFDVALSLSLSLSHANPGPAGHPCDSPSSTRYTVTQIFAGGGADSIAKRVLLLQFYREFNLPNLDFYPF